jgi:K+-sensing histidine kinase KdpD
VTPIARTRPQAIDRAAGRALTRMAFLPGSASFWAFPPLASGFQRWGFRERPMRNKPDYLFRVKPWSLPAFVLALFVLLIAATTQVILASFGTTLYFATFFPAILAASLLAGAPAGIFTAALTVPIVWWTFMPPFFEFNPLTPADYNDFVLFLLSSALVIWISHLYREALVILRQ